MNLFFKAATLLTCGLTCAVSLSPLPAVAQGFEKQEIDNRALAAIAAPYGSRAHQLRIVEQVGRTRSCWSEMGANPVEVDLLLNQFDYTYECGVGTDSNGFSIRMADQDLGLIYSLRVVERGGDLVLIGAPPLGVKAPEIEIGRTYGYTPGFAKIQLNPGWRFTRRIFNGKALGHIYITSDQPLPSWPDATATTVNPASNGPNNAQGNGLMNDPANSPINGFPINGLNSESSPPPAIPRPPLPTTANPAPDLIVPDLPSPDAGIPIAVPPPLPTTAPPPPPLR